MRYQMHHQSKKDSSLELIAQSEDLEDKDKIDAWCKEITQNNPLPEGFQWLMCNEKSEHFACTYNEESDSQDGH